MSKMIDFIASCDVIDRIEGWVFTFRYADWKGAYRKHGVLGLLMEFARSVVRANTTRHEFKRGEGIRGAEYEAMLRRHGVEIGDRGFGSDFKHLAFITKSRQGRWARWLMDHYPVGSEPPVRHLPRRRRKWKR